MKIQELSVTYLIVSNNTVLKRLNERGAVNGMRIARERNVISWFCIFLSTTKAQEPPHTLQIVP
jgi:hypothetical protein